MVSLAKPTSGIPKPVAWYHVATAAVLDPLAKDLILARFVGEAKPEDFEPLFRPDPPSTGWRYSINYGPDGEADWANLIAPNGSHVANIRIHHAMAICAARKDTPNGQ